MKLEIELLPFNTPNFVREKQKPGLKQEGFQEGKRWALNMVPASELHALCDQFKKDIFEKAGKLDQLIVPKKGGTISL